MMRGRRASSPRTWRKRLMRTSMLRSKGRASRPRASSMSLRRETTRLPCASSEASTRYSALRRLMGLPAGIAELARDAVELPAAEPEPACARGRRARVAAAAQDVAQARGDFARIHRLYQVIVRAHFQRHDAIHVVGARREYHQRHVAAGTQVAADAQRVFVADLQSQDDDVDARALHRAGQRATTGDRHAVAVALQMRRQRRTRLAFLVADEHVPVSCHAGIGGIARGVRKSSIQ